MTETSFRNLCKRIIFLTMICPTLCASDHALETTKSGETLVRHFNLRLAENATETRIEIREAEEKTPVSTLRIVPDDAGCVLQITTASHPNAEKKPVSKRNLVFWPAANDARAMARVKKLGLAPQSWKNRDIPGTIRFGSQEIKIWLEGRLILNRLLDGNKDYSLSMVPGKAVDFTWEPGRPMGDRYELLESAHLLGASGSPEIIKESGIPFMVWKGGRESFSLGNAGWPEWKDDPGSFFEAYDDGSAIYLMDEGRVPFVQVPKADYIAAYVLARAEEKPGTTHAFTIRAGRRNGSTLKDDAQLCLYDFVAEVPKGAAMQVVRVPFNESFAQNIEGNIMDLEITKELRLARRAPDPCRFRWRPLGLPSNVRIAAITLEKSPVQMECDPMEPAALFEQPEPVVYKIKLTNITGQPRDCTVTLASGENCPEISLRIPPGQSVERRVDLQSRQPGYHTLDISLRDKEEGELLRYRTAFGVLPPDTRRHREQAPWGTWDFGGDHFSPNDPGQVGEVMRKLGLRYGMFRTPGGIRRKYGVVKGNEFKVDMRTKEPGKIAEAYKEQKNGHPDLLPDLLVFHEDAISGEHATRIPDLFHDRPPYVLNDQEKERFRAMWLTATEAAKAMREACPEVTIHLGNGGHTVREEFYRNGFPAKLFDAGGNESAGFGRPPETQPPDGISINAGLWMDRELLDAYGYRDKPVSQAYEVIYPATNPGNLSMQTQADYFVRHILHAMAWKIPRIRPGCIADMGNSYYQSNWGGIGFFTSRSDWAPKPAAIALATLTSVLDGAEYEGFLETGSDSAYLLHFAKKDGVQVFPFWTVRGERDYSLDVEGTSAAQLVTPDGRTREIQAKDGVLTIQASASPAYLQLPKAASIRNIRLGPPIYPDSDPKGKISRLSSFDSLDGWKVWENPNLLLDYYNPMTPRRKGDFSIKTVQEFEGAGPALKVAAKPPKTGKATMPMYAELVGGKKMELPGKPAEIGLWVNGNSGWGRIIFELEDASGQRWTSIGARSVGDSEWMADWLGDKLRDDYKPGEIADWNTDDVFGLSRINFDGWKYVGFPLPGQYPGEGYHWPANSQWRSDKDGIVHYPLALKKVIIELPEKTLYLNRFEPPKRAEIYLRDIISTERDLSSPKTSPYEYVEAVQVSVD